MNGIVHLRPLKNVQNTIQRVADSMEQDAGGWLLLPNRRFVNEKFNPERPRPLFESRFPDLGSRTPQTVNLMLLRPRSHRLNSHYYRFHTGSGSNAGQLSMFSVPKDINSHTPNRLTVSSGRDPRIIVYSRFNAEERPRVMHLYRPSNQPSMNVKASQDQGTRIFDIDIPETQYNELTSSLQGNFSRIKAPLTYKPDDIAELPVWSPVFKSTFARSAAQPDTTS